MRSIRARLLAGLLALIAATAICAGVITYGSMLEETSSLFDYQLRQMALSLRDQAALGPNLILPSQPNGSDFIIQIRNPFGILIYTTRRDLLITRAVLGYADMTLGGERWRVYSLDTADGVIQVAQPWRLREQAARDATIGILVPLLLLLITLGAAIVWIVGRGLAPLRRLAAEVEQRDSSSFAPITAPELPSEAAPLVEELNRLLARLSAAFDAQRTFVADAAHELRSPLTALSLQLQLLDRAPDEAARVEARTRLGAAIERATHLASQLLTLARSEPEGAPLEIEPVDLEACARAGIADVHSLAGEEGVDVRFEAASSAGTADGAEADASRVDTARVYGDPDQLRILVRNLLDNAVRYTPRGGRVRVRVRPGAPGRGPALEVEDTGPGIPASERERAFDRFVRRPDAAEGGTGLGLAIVKAIAERHNAGIELADAPPHGLKVAVTFAQPPHAP
ncbi:MAG: ATP-binding protein [Steroidobacteraceae bacterium]